MLIVVLKHKNMYRFIYVFISKSQNIAGLFRVSLVIDLGGLWYLGNMPWDFYNK